MCRSLAPATFVADENGQSVVEDSQSEAIEDVFEAAVLCPVGAISLEDTTTGQPLEAP
jgi:ferredoxin